MKNLFRKKKTQLQARILVFESAEMTIVRSGEQITSKSLTRLQKAVRQKVEEVEKIARQQFEGAERKIDQQIEQLKAEADLTLVDLKNQNDDLSQKVKEEIKKQREELENLELLSFISEPRFRDLKSKWGNQVFRADMGAEAFHDILSRLGFG